MAAQGIQTVPQFLSQSSCMTVSKSVRLSLPEDPICNGTINLLSPFHCWLLNQNKRFSGQRLFPATNYVQHSALQRCDLIHAVIN